MSAADELYVSADGSVYNPGLGLWTDPAPGEVTALLWMGRIDERDAYDEPVRVTYWAEPWGTIA